MPQTSQQTARPISPADVLAVVLGAIAVIYLINPTAGVIELIPDNLPIVGNLDEAAATAIAIAALRHLGVDLTGFFGQKGPALPTPDAPNDASVDAPAASPFEAEE